MFIIFFEVALNSIFQSMDKTIVAFYQTVQELSVVLALSLIWALEISTSKSESSVEAIVLILKLKMKNTARLCHL